MTAPPVASPAPDLDAALGVPVTHLLLERRWGRQHVVVAGEEGPTVVLLHGWPQHWWAWRHVIRGLAPSRRLVAIDTRSFGWSRVETGRVAGSPVTTEDLAGDVLATLDDLSIAEAHVVGHDWGGWFAFEVALRAPARVRTVTAMAIMPPWLAARQVLRHSLGLLYLLPMATAGDLVAGAPRVVRAMLDASTGIPVWDGEDGRVARSSYTSRLTNPDARRTTRLLYRRMVAVELRRACGPRPPRLAMPATVVLGSREGIAHVDLFRERTYDGELAVEVVDGAGHWLLDEAPEPVTSLVSRLTV